MKFSTATTTALLIAIASLSCIVAAPTPDNEENDIQPVKKGIVFFPWSCYLANSKEAKVGNKTCPPEYPKPCDSYCSRTGGSCARLRTGLLGLGLISPVVGMLSQPVKTTIGSFDTLNKGNPFPAMLIGVTVPVAFPVGFIKGPFTVTRDAAKFIKICPKSQQKN